MKRTSKTSKSDYVYVEKNIYKTGKSYRVRVGRRSEYAPTLKLARATKKIMKNLTSNILVW
jgi:hypothetical protein